MRDIVALRWLCNEACQSATEPATTNSLASYGVLSTSVHCRAVLTPFGALGSPRWRGPLSRRQRRRRGGTWGISIFAADSI